MLDTILKALLLAGLALMFYVKLTTGTLNFYINQRFAWLSYVAVLILAVLALTMVYRLIEKRPSHVDVDVDVDVDGSGHDHDHDHDHGHPHRHRLSWSAIVIIAIPVVLGLLVPARPLGASAISNRGIGSSAPSSAGGVAQAQRVAVGPKNILDWLREFSVAADLNTFSGQAVDLTGFVYRDPRNAPNQFWVSRFTISCCVADAAAIGLLVQTDQASSLKNDSWVRVTGKLGVGEFDGEKLPMVVPDKIEPTEQPEQPYLYP